MKTFTTVAPIWLLCFALCAVATALAFTYLDRPVLQYCLKYAAALQPLGNGLGSTILLSLEAALALFIIVARLALGRMTLLGKSLALACLASICAYGIDSNVLKPLFGVPNPYDVAHGAAHAIHFWAGSGDSSFPSGHMVLAGAFAGVLMRLYRRSRWLLAAALLIAAVLLVLGAWHFLSDVIAGTFLGVSAGLLAGELWLAHTR